MKTYPTNARILVAEDVRTEVGGKHTIVGVFVGDDVRFERPKELPKEARPILPRLAVFALFSGGEGDFNAKIELVDSTGKIAQSAGPFPVTKVKDTNMAVNCAWTPVRFQVSGRYKVRILLDDKEYAQDFLVIEVAQAEEPAVTAA